MLRRLRFSVALASLLTAIPSFLIAQEVRGVITGIIKDPSGSVVPNVQVTVTANETGVRLLTRTNQDGLYQVTFLLPGVYTVVAESPGFEQMARLDVRIDPGTRVTVDLGLRMGSEKAIVEVSSEVPLIETTNADLGQVIPQEVVTEAGHPSIATPRTSSASPRGFRASLKARIRATIKPPSASTEGEGFRAATNGYSTACPTLSRSRPAQS
jgi:hypothetical protein